MVDQLSALNVCGIYIWGNLFSTILCLWQYSNITVNVPDDQVCENTECGYVIVGNL